MQHQKTLIQIAAATLMVAGLVGCGKAAPAAPEAPVIDSVFTKLPSKQAKTGIAKQQQEQNEAAPDARSETTKVGAPSDDKRG